LFKRFHLAFEPRQLGRRLTVAAAKKRGGPKDDDGDPRCNLIVRALLVLRAGDLGRMRRDVLRS
jgi:hypothetical protein